MSTPSNQCKCGSRLFHRNYRANGWWKQLIEASEDGSIEVVDTFLDHLKYGPEPKIVKCAECHRTCPNPAYKP